MTALPRTRHACPPSIVGTAGTAARCQVDDQLARRQLPAVDHRHHGDRAARRHGHGRGGGPGACQVDDRLAPDSARLPASIIGTTGGTMTALPVLGTLAGVDRRHHGDRGAMTDLPAVSFPPSIIGTTGGTMTSLPASIIDTTGGTLPGR